MFLIYNPTYLILDYNYNIYGLDWKTRGVWRLGLLQKVKLPLSIDNLQIIEKLIVSLMRIEVYYRYLLSNYILCCKSNHFVFFGIGNFASYTKNS